MERRKRNFSLKSRQQRREGEFFPKILKIESRKRIFPSKSHKSRGKREIFFSIFKIESRKRNCSFKSLKSRGERENVLKNPEKSRLESEFFSQTFQRDLKIHFSNSREKFVGHFSSRISRDRDSCQGLSLPQGSPPQIHAAGIWALPFQLLHPPPRTQTGTLGHFFPGRFERLCQITVLRVNKCHKESWQALNPLLTKENT